MEKALLREVTLTHWHDLREMAEDSFKPAGDAFTRSFMEHFQIVKVPWNTSPVLVRDMAHRCAVGDIVMVTDPAVVGRVDAHVRYGLNDLTLVTCFDRVSPNRFRESDVQRFVDTSCLKGGLVYKQEEKGILVAPQSFYSESKKM